MSNAIDVVMVPLRLASPGFLADLEVTMIGNGMRAAVADRDTATIFDWLMGLIQLQGISDASAFAYSATHGLPTFSMLERAVAPASCTRLRSYWNFNACGFAKAAATCSNPDLMWRCGVPGFPARNGRLAQAAVSLFLFTRDICGGDLVGWLDGRLDPVEPSTPGPMRTAVLEPLSQIFGVSIKVMSMAMADLLLGSDPGRERWVTTGAAMIAIDSLVHNFLHRTGAIDSLGVRHAYGEACYRPGGCAEVIEALSRSIDARQFNPTFPHNFPRFIQHAIWSFCAAGGWNICNGNQIDDRTGCDSRFCPAGSKCDRHPVGL